MKKTLKDKISDRLVSAFLKNKTISPIPKRFTKKLTEADMKIMYQYSMSGTLF